MSTLEESLIHCRNIYAIGRNYQAHARELNNPLPLRPLLFTKTLSSLTTQPLLQLPGSLGPIHHEVEIVIEIGQYLRPGHFANLDCLSRIGLGIDFTAREEQTKLKTKGHPWLRAKSFHHAAYVAELVPFNQSLPALQFQLKRNDILVQNGTTEDMIFNLDRLLTDLNQTRSLQKGDLIFTGTPEGVGPVENGDRLELVCESLNIHKRASVTMI